MPGFAWCSGENRVRTSRASAFISVKPKSRAGTERGAKLAVIWRKSYTP